MLVDLRTASETWRREHGAETANAAQGKCDFVCPMLALLYYSNIQPGNSVQPQIPQNPGGAPSDARSSSAVGAQYGSGALRDHPDGRRAAERPPQDRQYDAMQVDRGAYPRPGAQSDRIHAPIGRPWPEDRSYPSHAGNFPPNYRSDVDMADSYSSRPHVTSPHSQDPQYAQGYVQAGAPPGYVRDGQYYDRGPSGYAQSGAPGPSGYAQMGAPGPSRVDAPLYGSYGQQQYNAPAMQRPQGLGYQQPDHPERYAYPSPSSTVAFSRDQETSAMPPHQRSASFILTQIMRRADPYISAYASAPQYDQYGQREYYDYASPRAGTDGYASAMQNPQLPYNVRAGGVQPMSRTPPGEVMSQGRRDTLNQPTSSASRSAAPREQVGEASRPQSNRRDRPAAEELSKQRRRH